MQKRTLLTTDTAVAKSDLNAPTLKAAQLTYDVAIRNYKRIISTGRGALAKERYNSRRKALNYAKLTRKRSFSAGYKAGFEAAKSETTSAICHLRSCYEDAIKIAHRDTYNLALEIATKIIDTTLVREPAAILNWIQQALQILKNSRNLELSCHPRYSNLLTALQDLLPPGIKASINPDLKCCDFILLDSESLGGIEFSWQDVL
jgi:flagellar biosynthesis/type III secretory pathway protein FliH